MANLAAADVTLVESWAELKSHGKTLVSKKLDLSLSSMGSATNQIQATVLGLTTIVRASSAVKSDSSEVVVAGPNQSGSLLLLKASGSNTPADYSGVYRVTVEGF